MIIRKPKFMRNVSAATAYMTLAENFAMLADKSDTTDEIYEYMKKSGEYINKAAKAAGFLKMVRQCKSKIRDLINWVSFFLKGENFMNSCTYAYLCNLQKCKDCSFPKCSHTTDQRYRMPCGEDTEMKLVGSINSVDYYMEFLKKEVK